MPTLDRLAIRLVLLWGALAAGCSSGHPERRRLTVSGSASGAEARVLALQIARFEKLHPDVDVVSQPVPESADERHQLYVQWLNARVPEPDVLQLDVIWLQEFAAAGWLEPLPQTSPAIADFLPGALQSARYRGSLYALPWFVDVGMLYFRKDWFSEAPETFEALIRDAQSAQAQHGADYGLVFQGARYEGLVTVYLEFLGGFGGSILDDQGRVTLDSEPAARALGLMHDTVHGLGIAPASVLSFQEEQARFAFQSGQAAFMRNWPYAYALMQSDPGSAVRGKIGIAPMPKGPSGQPTAALGGQELALNAHGAEPELGRQFIEFLCEPEQMLERARIAGQLPARRSVYDDPRLAAALPFEPKEILRIVERATPRPLTPVYTELSQALQLELHRALSDQETPRAALGRAAHELRRILERAGLGAHAGRRTRHGAWGAVLAGLAVLGALLVVGARRIRGRRRMRPLSARERREQGLSRALVAPALLVIVAMALVPLGLALFESFRLHDLRRPWLGTPFVGFDNYLDVLGSARFWGALGRTLGFTLASVGLELGFGLGLALLLNRSFRGRGLLRALSLVPWAMPTVVVALAFRFLFDDRVGPCARLAVDLGLTAPGSDWFSREFLAWVPIVLADVWKTSPFVALLLLAGLSSVPREVYEAAAVDGAGAARQLWAITLPLLRSVLLVVVVFRSLDAFRVFDLIYVLTHGGPGVATEPIALYTHAVLLQNLDFGRGATLSVLVFVVTLGLCLLYVRLIGERSPEGKP